MIDRYTRNGILTDKQQRILAEKKVAVIGCGGLGGYVAEMLGRLGVRHLVLCDGDNFCVSNLNRQILATEDNLGKNKADMAKKRMQTVNSEVSVRAFPLFLTRENATDILSGCDVVCDALDSTEGKCMLEDICEKLELPLVHGAVGGWCGQVCTVMPHDRTLHRLYAHTDESDQREAENIGNPSFTPAAVAAMQVSEILKVLLRKDDELLREEILFIDLEVNEFRKMKL